MKKKILIVSSSFYEDITNNLLDASIKVLSTNGNSEKFSIDKFNVPGVFEIPVMISKNLDKYEGFIALGCVIKGETPHFDYISKSTIQGLMDISILSKKPVGNGIITSLDVGQAKARSNLDSKKNKGKEAANALIKVLAYE